MKSKQRPNRAATLTSKTLGCHRTTRHLSHLMLIATAVLLFSACTGLFDGLYDDPEEAQMPSVEGSLYLDASDWGNWYYIDLKALVSEDTKAQALASIGRPYPIPTTLTGDSDGFSGLYTYWYDVFGAGLSVNERRDYTPTDRQQAPAEWTLAIHRDNVRTNGGAACVTASTDLDQFAPSRQELASYSFTADEWTENVVWVDQSQMLNSIIGSQGIAINPVLSAWLQLVIPPVPPSFTHNNHVYVVRLNDGTYAALQLTNYMSPSGTKCCLTIRYRYPL